MAFYDLKKKPALTTKRGRNGKRSTKYSIQRHSLCTQIIGKSLVWNRLHCRRIGGSTKHHYGHGCTLHR